MFCENFLWPKDVQLCALSQENKIIFHMFTGYKRLLTDFLLMTKKLCFKISKIFFFRNCFSGEFYLNLFWKIFEKNFKNFQKKSFFRKKNPKEFLVKRDTLICYTRWWNNSHVAGKWIKNVHFRFLCKNNINTDLLCLYMDHLANVIRNTHVHTPTWNMTYVKKNIKKS